MNQQTLPPSGTNEPFSEQHNNLPATLKLAWQMLGRGVHDRRSAFHAPVLATQSAQGPQARVLVLRACDPQLRVLTFYTDTRSAKMQALQTDARVAVTFYDAARKTHVRINGSARVHAGDSISHQRWAHSGPRSLRCFLGAQPGGVSPVPTSGLPADVEGRVPEMAQLQAAEQHFAVLQVSVQQLEWLHLHTGGQRRAVFSWAEVEDTDCRMQWLNP